MSHRHITKTSGFGFGMLVAAAAIVALTYPAHGQAPESADEPEGSGGEPQARDDQPPAWVFEAAQHIAEGNVDALKPLVTPDGTVDVMFFNSSCDSYAEDGCAKLKRFVNRRGFNAWLEKAKDTWNCSPFDNDECAWQLLVVGQRGRCKNTCCSFFSMSQMHGALNLSRLCFEPHGQGMRLESIEFSY